MAVSSKVWDYATPTSIALIVALLLVYTAASAVINYRKLSQFNGPPLAAISMLWVVKQTLLGRLNDAALEALEKYGSPCRIGPNMLVTNDPVTLRHINQARSTFKRSNWYTSLRLDPRIDNVISERNEKRHVDLRSRMIPAYSGRDLPHLEQDIDEQVVELLKLIKREYTGKTIDFAPVAQYFTLDVLTKVAFGDAFGYLTKNEDVHDYIKTIRAFMPVLEMQANINTFRIIMQSRFIQMLAGPTAKDRVGLGAVIGVAQRVVGERYGPDAKIQNDMLGSFITHGLTQREAESESLMQIMAGTDSTSTAVRVIFLFILTNPLAYAKLRAEINGHIAQGNLSSPVIKNAEALKMPYLQACIKEGLRHWPPLTGLMTKNAPPQGEMVNGVFIPGSTAMSWSAHATQHRKDIYGDDADSYRPERFLDVDPDTRLLRDKTVELVFGHGRYGCLGKTIAFMELNKVFVALLQNYDWGIVNPITPMKTRCNGIHIQQNFHIRAYARLDSVW